MTPSTTALIAELNEKREKVKDLPISLDIGDSSQRYVHIINANDQTVFYKYDASAPTKKYDLSRLLAHSETEVSPAAYFLAKNVGRDPMRPLGKACHDCAVEGGLYTEYTDELAKMEPSLIHATAVRWFCHNHTDRACRGNIDRLIGHGCDPLFDGAPLRVHAQADGEGPVLNTDNPPVRRLWGT